MGVSKLIRLPNEKLFLSPSFNGKVCFGCCQCLWPPRFGKCLAKVRSTHLKKVRSQARQFLKRAAQEGGELDGRVGTNAHWLKHADLTRCCLTWPTLQLTSNCMQARFYIQFFAFLAMVKWELPTHHTWDVLPARLKKQCVQKVWFRSHPQNYTMEEQLEPVWMGYSKVLQGPTFHPMHQFAKLLLCKRPRRLPAAAPSELWSEVPSAQRGSPLMLFFFPWMVPKNMAIWSEICGDL